ncbi:hypothetical protein [Aeoliella sp.]|uniref:hypothetical protein n=1 Tax=Aeoliella sp. TaxID=2795800 RepID=UPI003CCC0BCF
MVLFASILLAPAAVWAADGELRLQAVDSKTHQPVPVRVELSNSRGRPVRLKRVGAAELGTHFYLSGTATLGLRRGDYLFTMDAGPEFRTQTGNFTIDRYADDEKSVEMRRFANLADEGWYAGDLDSQRLSRDLPIVAATEGVHYAPSTAWTFDGQKWAKPNKFMLEAVDGNDPFAAGRTLGPYTARVELAGGTLLLISDQPLEAAPLELKPGVTSLEVIQQARAAGLHVVAASPTAWEYPLWVASGELDGVCLLTRQSELKRVVGKDPNGRPWDKSLYPGKTGLVRWSEDIYFHTVNCGIELSPLAGSGSGANESPLGTNCTYAYLTNAFTPTAWWDAVDRGAVVVTNGPLLRPSVSGEPPGTKFRLDNGETLDFQIALNMASRQTVEYLEILKNGEVDVEVRLSDWASKGGKLPPVSFDTSGWFAVRAKTNNADIRQFALTAPYYVESPAGPRISRASVEFFLAWLDQLEPRIGQSLSCTAEQLATAREFYRDLLGKASAQ